MASRLQWKDIDQRFSLRMPRPGLVLDAVPRDVVAQLLAGDEAAGGALDEGAPFFGNGSISAHPTRHIRGVGSDGRAKFGLLPPPGGHVLG